MGNKTLKELGEPWGMDLSATHLDPQPPLTEEEQRLTDEIERAKQNLMDKQKKAVEQEAAQPSQSCSRCNKSMILLARDGGCRCEPLPIPLGICKKCGKSYMTAPQDGGCSC